MKKYCVIGKGFIYPRHVQAIEKTGGKILLTCDVDPKKNPDFTDWMEMYRSPLFEAVETVVILAPNYLHAVMAREARLRGKKVICEKPATLGCPKTGIEDVCTVLQLRNHPEIQGLSASEIHVEAKMFRDGTYWGGWKGNQAKSGGILFNLGVHYIDLMCYLLGKPLYIKSSVVRQKVATGEVIFADGVGTFHIEIVDDKSQQGRVLLADGVRINLSDKENLSYEDLHTEVYKQFLDGTCPTFKDAEDSINLISDLIAWSK